MKMNYLVIVEVQYVDESKPVKAMYDATSEDDAISKFHLQMGKYINVDNVASVNVIAKNNVGGIYKNEYWKAYEEPTPVPEVDAGVDVNAE